MDIFKAFATNVALETEGRWHRIGGTDDQPAEIKVARTGTKKYNAFMAQRYAAHKTLFESKDPGDMEKAALKVDEMIVEALSTFILLDWKNITYKGDATVSVQNAAAMLQHRDFRELVEREANNFAAYRLEQVEADAKNSQPA